MSVSEPLPDDSGLWCWSGHNTWRLVSSSHHLSLSSLSKELVSTLEPDSSVVSLFDSDNFLISRAAVYGVHFHGLEYPWP